MDKIHDKASKLFSDARGKKILVGKNIRCDNMGKAKPELSLNSCFYCHKVFVNSQFLMKHILRRHSDDLISLHKNCVKHESNNNSNDFRCLMSFVEKEFLTLKNVLLTVRQGAVDKNEVSNEFKVDNCTEENSNTYVGESCQKTDVCSINDDNLNVLKAFKESISLIERNLEGLQHKFEDRDKMLKNDFVLKNDMIEHMAYTDEKIKKTHETQSMELRQILLNDLQSMVSKQMYENNCEWLAQLSELKDDIVSLDKIVTDINKQINSPDSLKEIEKRLERQITYFLCNKSNRNSKKKHSRCKAQLAGASVKGTKPLRYETELSVAKTTTCQKNKSIKHVDEKNNLQAHKVFKNCNLPNELSILVAEKFSELCIEPNTSKLSSAEHEEKLKLLNAERERLASAYPSFFDFYNSMNMRANHRVHNKLKHRHRKIRFSNPLTTSRKSAESDRNAASSLAMGDGPVPEVSPMLHNLNKEVNEVKNQLISKSDIDKVPASKEKSFLINKNQRDLNSGASGDNSFKFSNNLDPSINEMMVNACEFKSPSPASKSLISEMPSSLPSHNKLSDIYKSQLRSKGELHATKSNQYLTTTKQRFPYTNGGASGEFRMKFSKKTDTSICQAQSVNAEEFKKPGSVPKTDDIKKSRVTFAEESSVINSDILISREMQNYALTEVKNSSTAKTSDNSHFYQPRQKTGLMEGDNLKSLEDASDASELESLSSWEDEDDVN